MEILSSSLPALPFPFIFVCDSVPTNLLYLLSRLYWLKMGKIDFRAQSFPELDNAGRKCYTKNNKKNRKEKAHKNGGNVLWHLPIIRKH